MQIDFDTYQKIVQPDFLSSVFDKTSTRKYLCQITQPKSGSWWVCSFLGQFFYEDGPFRQENYFNESLLPAFGARYQEIDPSRFFLKGDLDAYTFFVPIHARYSQYTRELIEKSGMKVILQVRNVSDSLYSASRFMVSIARGKRFLDGALPIGFEQWSNEQVIDYNIRQSLPFTCQFLSGWLNSDLIHSGQVLLVDFDDLKTSTHETFVRIAEFCRAFDGRWEN